MLYSAFEWVLLNQILRLVKEITIIIVINFS